VKGGGPADNAPSGQRISQTPIHDAKRLQTVRKLRETIANSEIGASFRGI
jgi:hypothetical protein